MDTLRPVADKPADTTAARLVDAVITITEEHDVVYANPAVRRILGYGPKELLGRSVLDLVPAPLRPTYRKRLESYVEGVRSETEVDPFEMKGRRADGAECVLELSLGPHVTNGRLLLTGVLRDVTAQRNRVAALHATAKRDRQLFEQNRVGVYRVGFDGAVLEANEAMARMLGYSRDELIGLTAVDLYFDAADREEWIGNLLEHGLLANHVHQLRQRDGGAIWTLESCQIVDDPVTGNKCVLGTAIDISERKAAEDRLAHYAYHDSLTGLPNRRWLQEASEKAIAHCERSGEAVAMLHIDLIRFKRINDTLGHAAGDTVICEVARRLRDVCRVTDTLARVGGDEFAVLLFPARGMEEVLGPATRVRERLSAPIVVSGETLHVEARIGAAMYPDHGTSFDELLTNADFASHQPGSNDAETAIYQPVATPATSRSRLVMEEDLRRAIEEDRLVLFYQPIYRLADGGVAGVEGLARWPQPDGRLLSGDEFIPLAEHTGLIRGIDRWTLRESLSQLSSWTGPDDPAWISINLTPCAFDDPDFAEHVQEALDEFGVSGDRVVAEVTERISMRDPVRGERILRGLRKSGIRIVIDDFGRGHSSIAYLRDLPIDGMKIDLSFITRIGSDENTERLVEGMLALGHGLGLDVTAEGVESAQQLEWLTKRGCGFGQGYHLHRPCRPEQIGHAHFATRAQGAPSGQTRPVDRTTRE